MVEQPVLITAREDLGVLSLRGAPQALTAALTAVDLPQAGLRQIAGSATGQVAWISPDERVVFAPVADISRLRQDLKAAFGTDLHLCEEITSGRVVLSVKTPKIRDFLARLAPVDLHPSAFPKGSFRRARLGQIQCAFYLPAEDEAVIVTARSYGHALQILLQSVANAAPPLGLYAG